MRIPYRDEIRARLWARRNRILKNAIPTSEQAYEDYIDARAMLLDMSEKRHAAGEPQSPAEREWELNNQQAKTKRDTVIGVASFVASGVINPIAAGFAATKFGQAAADRWASGKFKKREQKLETEVGANDARYRDTIEMDDKITQLYTGGALAVGTAVFSLPALTELLKSKSVTPWLTGAMIAAGVTEHWVDEYRSRPGTDLSRQRAFTPLLTKEWAPRNAFGVFEDVAEQFAQELSGSKDRRVQRLISKLGPPIKDGQTNLPLVDAIYSAVAAKGAPGLHNRMANATRARALTHFDPISI